MKDTEAYTGIAEATKDVRTKVNSSDLINHPFSSPALSVIIPAWTEALTGFEAKVNISTREAEHIEQIHALYENQKGRLSQMAKELKIGILNEHEPAKVLFMGLFRDLQLRFASKRNLNPHKLAVIIAERYEVDE
jgi:hypothetical protein